MITYRATQSENIILKIDGEKNTSTFIPVPIPVPSVSIGTTSVGIGTTSVGIATTTISGVEMDMVGGGEYLKYLKWVSEGNTIEPYIDPTTTLTRPQWKQFLQSIKQTNTFGLLRIQSRLDVGFNGLATELRTELGEAALGISSAGNVQPLLNELAVGLSTSQKEELYSLITQYNIPLSIAGIGTTSVGIGTIARGRTADEDIVEVQTALRSR